MTMPTSFDLALTRRWIAARVRLNMRNPRAVIFTFVMPLFFMLLFNALNSGARVEAVTGGASEVVFAQFYTPAMAVFGLVVACYTTLIMGVSNARDSGLLKRVRGTPLPMPIYLGSWAVGAALVGFASVLLLFVVAVPVYGVHIYVAQLPAAVLTLVLGAFALTGLGLAIASLVRDADQAMPVAQITFLPLSFISGLFFPLTGAPDWLLVIAKIFPLYHLREAFGSCFVPGGGVAIGDLAVLAIWGLVALRIAARRFGAETETGGRRLRLLGRARSEA